tara:strand:- start:323 stop:520 length:198 start_codon:yes stop_codon:yes gene_type:complete
MSMDVRKAMNPQKFAVLVTFSYKRPSKSHLTMKPSACTDPSNMSRYLPMNLWTRMDLSNDDPKMQ